MPNGSNKMDIVIRGLDSATLKKLAEEQKRLKLKSRNELLLKKLEMLALTGFNIEQGDYKKMSQKTLNSVSVNCHIREKIYEFFPELELIHKEQGGGVNDKNS